MHMQNMHMHIRELKVNLRDWKPMRSLVRCFTSMVLRVIMKGAVMARKIEIQAEITLVLWPVDWITTVFDWFLFS